MIATIAGAMLPSDEALFPDDKMWRVIFGLPIIFAVLQISILLIYF
jgi:hypothetical protein